MELKIAKIIRLVLGSAALLVGLVLVNAERMKRVADTLSGAVHRISVAVEPLSDIGDEISQGFYRFKNAVLRIID